jgi:hypothetical protein
MAFVKKKGISQRFTAIGGADVKIHMPSPPKRLSYMANTDHFYH